MQFAILLIVLLTGTWGQPVAPEISGSIGPTLPHEYPFMVRLNIRGFLCGASLISPRFLAAAYHCFYSNKFPKINFNQDCSIPGTCYAVVREHDLTKKEVGQRDISIKAIHRPPFGDSDLALVELEYPVVLDERAQPVRVAEERLAIGDLVLTLGWGQAFQGTLPDVLLKVLLRVSEVDMAGDLTFTEVGENAIGIPVDPCNGDSGGPLLAEKEGEWLLYATLLGGGYNCETDKTSGDGVWNSLAPHKDWIQEILNITGPGITKGILLTGGSIGGGTVFNSSALFPSSPTCTTPSLPYNRAAPVTFATNAGLVATCGGFDGSVAHRSCLVLEAGRWRPDPRVPDLPQARASATSATLAMDGGVYIMGGWRTETSSLVLMPGASSWVEGPTLPGRGADSACTVTWGKSVILIGGKPEYTQVREYNTVKKMWEEEAKWPQLGGKGRQRHGCSLLGSQLVVTGGWDRDDTTLHTTVTLDLRFGLGAAWVEAGQLLTPRGGLALVAFVAAGKERLYAIGGVDGSDGGVVTVERWEEEIRRWTEEEERLPEARGWMGALAVTETACIV